jgi:dihydrofolate reductase
VFQIMRKLIVQEFVSADGLAADARGAVEFVPAATKSDPSFGRRQTVFIDSIDAILLGRVTYELFTSYWPYVPEGDDDKPFADKLNAIPKIVFSRTLERAPWGRFEPARIVSANVPGAVAALKQEPGKNMVLWGSLSVAQELLKAGAVDEVQLIVCPVTLGGGRTTFGEHAQTLTLLHTQSFGHGSVLLAYAPGSV